MAMVNGVNRTNTDMFICRQFDNNMLIVLESQVELR